MREVWDGGYFVIHLYIRVGPMPYVRDFKNGEVKFTDDKYKAKSWKLESSVHRWMEKKGLKQGEYFVSSR